MAPRTLKLKEPTAKALPKPAPRTFELLSTEKLRCGFCQKEISRSKHNVKRHESGCSSNPDAVYYNCPICCRSFARPENFRNHERNCHLEKSSNDPTAE